MVAKKNGTSTLEIFMFFIGTYDNPNIAFICDLLNEVIVGRELYDWSR